jgi:hypothetical protein
LTFSLLYAFGSLAWFYAGVLYSDQLVGLMLTLAGLCAVRYRSCFPPAAGESRVGAAGWAFAAGAALSLALLSRWDTALLVIVPISAYFLYTRVSLRRREHGFWWGLVRDASLFLAPILLAAAVNVAYDVFRYGRPLGGPYGTVVGFTTPLLTGLYGLLLSPGAGLLIFVPIVLLAPFGARALYRRWPALAVLIISLILIRLLFYARWGDWAGGTTWGPRYLVPVLPMLFVLIAFVPQRRWTTPVTTLLAGVSVAIEMLGQVVPYGAYFTSIYAQLSRRAAVNHACGGCRLDQRVEIVNRTLHFDPRFAPLVGQFNFVRQGLVDPLWAHLAPIVPLILVVLAAVYIMLRRQAGSLDRRVGAEPSVR